MDIQEENYYRIARAISFIRENHKAQPSLDEIAREVDLSPSHFQRVFSEWAGTSPKKFMQHISIQHAKKVLMEGKSLFETSFEMGLSSTSRLHDLFVGIEKMTPAEYKHGGKGLRINYSFNTTPYGPVLMAASTRGICHIAFFDGDRKTALEALFSEYPQADFNESIDDFQKAGLEALKGSIDRSELRIHLKGTDFQLKVWEALLRIPEGSLVTYDTIAKAIGKPKAQRAVGTAIGKNPIALLIPCHRVIRSNGEFGGYRWNQTRKAAIIGKEMGKDNS